MVAHAKLTEPLVMANDLLAKPRSFSNIPAFLDLDGRNLIDLIRKIRTVYDTLIGKSRNRNPKEKYYEMN